MKPLVFAFVWGWAAILWAQTPASPPPTVVQSVYPTADVLPANLLKFYVYFSRPMRETARIFDQISILDEQTGLPIDDPWRRTMMFSDDATRVTLLIHPGRIKKGVNLREELGPVLLPGRRYTLILGADLLDGDGRPLGHEYRKSFSTSAEDPVRPSLDLWRIEPPAAASSDPLIAIFPKPLDHALARRMIIVLGPDRRPVPGRVELMDHQTRWRFIPDRPWVQGSHVLAADENLEDLAGNTPSRVFDADLDNPDQGPVVLQRQFTPR
jgi:hypothetical protein